MRYLGLNKLLLLVVLLIIIIITLKLFRLTPLSDIENILRFSFTSIGFIIFILFYQKIDNLIKIWIIIFLSVFLVSLYSGYFVLGQDIKSCIIANLFFLHTFSVIPVHIILKNSKINASNLQNMFKGTAWFQLIVFSVLAYGGIELTYQSIFTNNILVIDAVKIYKFFIQWGLIYFFLRYTKSFGVFSLIFFLLFLLIPIIYDLKRLQTICMLMVFGFIFFQYRKRISTVVTILIIGLTFLLTISLFYNSIIKSETYLKYQEAFKILKPEQEIEDWSTRARIKEVKFVFEMIKGNWLTGVGKPRTSKKKELLNIRHFHVDDIGVFGILFTSGLLGLFVFLLQWNRIFKEYRSLTKIGTFGESIFYFLLFLMIYSIGTGILFFYPNIFLLLIIILNEIKSQKEEIKSDNLELKSIK